MKLYMLCAGFMLAAMSPIRAEQAAVTIGKTNYTDKQLDSLDQGMLTKAVEYVKQQQAIAMLAKERSLKPAATRQDLYRHATGHMWEKDSVISRRGKLNSKKRNMASMRRLAFDRWLKHLADAQVPVSYIDAETFGNPVYTWHELSIDPKSIVATRGGVPFVDGAEFNAYLRVRYANIRGMADRRQKRDELLDTIAARIVEGKLAMDWLREEDAAAPRQWIDKALQNYVRSAMMDAQLDIGSIDAQGYAGFKRALEDQYRKKHSKQLEKIQKMLTGKGPVPQNKPALRVLTYDLAREALQYVLANTTEEKKIYKWMEGRAFHGGLSEARAAYAHDEYRKIINTRTERAGIIINLPRK